MKVLKSIQFKLKKYNYLNNNIKRSILNKSIKLFHKNDINICYNNYIPLQYNPNKRNILIAIESPAVIEQRKWLQPEMKFDAEISFLNFYNLDNYLCCRDLYVNMDGFLNVQTGAIFTNKPNLVSIVCSDKKILWGHKFRHQITERYKTSLDVYGSGFNKFGDIDDAFINYQFQVVIENGKYPEYVSEKFFDCIKTQTIPIYWGGEEGVRKMGFDTKGIIFFNELNDLKYILKQLNTKLYEEKKKAALYNLARLIELRNENKMNIYLNTVMFGYMHSTKSYLGYKFNNLNLELD